MIRLPPEDQVETAIAWLESNEGDGGEADACNAVAAYLRHVLDDAALRQAAREHGVTVARLRRVIAERGRA